MWGRNDNWNRQYQSQFEDVPSESWSAPAREPYKHWAAWIIGGGILILVGVLAAATISHAGNETLALLQKV